MCGCSLTQNEQQGAKSIQLCQGDPEGVTPLDEREVWRGPWNACNLNCLEHVGIFRKLKDICTVKKLCVDLKNFLLCQNKLNLIVPSFQEFCEVPSCVFDVCISSMC